MSKDWQVVYHDDNEERVIGTFDFLEANKQAFLYLVSKGYGYYPKSDIANVQVNDTFWYYQVTQPYPLNYVFVALNKKR